MGSSKLLWFLPLNLYIGLPRGNGVDWDEPLLIDENKISRPDSNSSYSNSQPNNENDIGDVKQNQNGNNRDDRTYGDNGSMSSLYKSSYEVINNCKIYRRLKNKVI
jgi:hypothetical protein